MHGAILIRWGANIPGREAAGMDVFGRAVAWFEQMAKEGRVQGHREYFSVTGHNGGFMMVDGELDELMKIVGEEETLRLNARAAAVASDFEINVFAGGTDQTVQQLMGNFAEDMGGMGYM